MTLIVSLDGDQTTNQVCERFFLNKIYFDRLNVDNYINSDMDQNYRKPYLILDDLDNILIGLSDECDSNLFFNKAYNCVWFRKPNIRLSNISVDNRINKTSKKLNSQFLANKRSEHLQLFQFLLNRNIWKKQLGSLAKSSLNKLTILELAVKCNIKIPKSIICTNKKTLINFMNSIDAEVITKSIYEGISVIDEDKGEIYSSYTVLLDKSNLEKIPNKFSPSLIQERIIKEVEIRSFYLNGKFYSMAIFSQNNIKTQVDFRHYDSDLPNRCVPFQLPKTIENKLAKLFKVIDLNTGSIDLIKTHQNDYVFLEINPVGQFGMVSYPCNYNLESKVYEFISKN